MVDGVVASCFNKEPRLTAAESETLKQAANANARLAWRLAPGLIRRLHAWRALMPAHYAVSGAARQVLTAG